VASPATPGHQALDQALSEYDPLVARDTVFASLGG
jgi:hypothetical protein